ncbi:MAG: hypothetical protein Q8O84_03090 [Nanoarchaeota archaeon]|nr:hypothetical protein [Nanoarchaeota archaeon]
MGLFKRKKTSERKQIKDIPELPELPKLPSLPEESEFETTLPQLPKYSVNSFNDKFHQNTIKDAISGKKEEMLEADEFVREQMMPEHLERKSSDFAREKFYSNNERDREPSDFARFNPEGKFEKSERGREQSSKMEFPYKMERPAKELELRNWQEPKTKKSGQVFIKIDKFEESLKIFELTKSKISEMEKMLEDIRELKEKEEKELSYWMAEIQTIKNQTDKVERDIFSKLE